MLPKCFPKCPQEASKSLFFGASARKEHLRMVFVKHNFCRLSCPNHFTFSRGSVCFLTSDDLFISHWRNVCEASPKNSFQVALPLYCNLFSCLYLLCCWIHVSFFATSLSSFANGAYSQKCARGTLTHMYVQAKEKIRFSNGKTSEELVLQTQAFKNDPGYNTYRRRTVYR